FAVSSNVGVSLVALNAGSGTFSGRVAEHFLDHDEPAQFHHGENEHGKNWNNDRKLGDSSAEPLGTGRFPTRRLYQHAISSVAFRSKGALSFSAQSPLAVHLRSWRWIEKAGYPANVACCYRNLDFDFAVAGNAGCFGDVSHSIVDGYGNPAASNFA